MIVLHRGVTADNIPQIGYALIFNQTAYIVTLQGRMTEVKRESIQPIIDKDADAYSGDIEHFTKGDACIVHGIEGLREQFGEALVLSMKSRGIYYIEDLYYWTKKDLMALRGIGRKRAEALMSFLEQYKSIDARTHQNERNCEE